MSLSGLRGQPAPLPVPRHTFMVIAHRGDHTEAPENTLAAYRNGIKNGVDYVEIDLRTTRDSVLVIMHDATVDRMTNGHGKVSELTYEQLRRLRVVDKRDSTVSCQVPSFEEVLQTCRDKVYIYLDFKDASVQQSFDLIRKYGMERQFIVYINSEQQFVQWRTLFPQVPLMLSLPDEVKTTPQLQAFLSSAPVALLDGDYSDYTPEMIKAAASRGIPAWPDIQSAGEAANWDRAISMGFRGLQTDHPALLISYLKKRGLRHEAK